MQELFELHGYDLITTPLFEYAEVFERSLTQGDRRDLVRFVEPDTGEVVALRPDITPQIARVLAARMSSRPPPWRVRYEGTVIRRRRGRARKQQQVAQAGIELVGLEGSQADAEIMGLASAACKNAGLHAHHLELSHVGIGETLLASVPTSVQVLAREYLARKDTLELERVLKEAGMDRRTRRPVLGLTELYGDLDVLRKARRRLANTDAMGALEELQEVSDLLEASGCVATLGVDLGEQRGALYYTGVSFHLLAAGPGEPVAAGGRYDDLMARHGARQPATGMAIDLENLLWALDHAGEDWGPARRPRVALVSGRGPSLQSNAAGAQVASRLRSEGWVVAHIPRQSQAAMVEFARAWAYDGIIQANQRSVTATRTADATQAKFNTETPEQLGELSSWFSENAER